MRFLVDTCVLSELIKKQPVEAVVAWIRPITASAAMPMHFLLFIRPWRRYCSPCLLLLAC